MDDGHPWPVPEHRNQHHGTGTAVDSMRTGFRRVTLLVLVCLLGTIYAAAKVRTLYGYSDAFLGRTAAATGTVGLVPARGKFSNFDLDGNFSGFDSQASIERLLMVGDNELLSNVSLSYPVYVRSTYYVASRKLLRLIVIRQCSDKTVLYAHIGQQNAAGQKLTSRVISACPWHFNPMCHHAGFFLDLKVDATGAQKIFLYVQSVAPEVKPLLEIYVMEGIVELVPWSLMPAQNVSGHIVNANFDVYRTEVVAAINDCLLRAAASGSRFTAFVDLDELIHVNQHAKVTKYLENLPSKMATVMFASTNTHYSVPESYYPTESGKLVAPADVDLSYLEGAKRENFVHPYGRRSKLIVRPTLVDAIHVHDYLRLVPGAKYSSLRAKHSAGGGLTLHLRRVMSLTHGERNATVTLPGLAALVKQASTSWQERVKKYKNIATSPLPSRGVSIMSALEECSYALYKYSNETCTSVQAKCVDKVGHMVKSDQWLLAEDSWTVV